MGASHFALLCLLVALGGSCAHGDTGARRLFQVANATATLRNVTASNATLPNATLPNITIPSNATLLTATLPNATLPNATLPNATLSSALNRTANASLPNGTYIALVNSSRYQLFDVTNFGAKGDGVTNDTQAFILAIKAACAQNLTTGVISVPYNKTFLVGSVALKGCNNTVFELMGTILAQPYGSPTWPSKPVGIFYLQSFSNFTIQGNGTIDGSGYDWWQGSFNSSNQLVRPDIVHMDTGSNLVVTGIRLLNPPQVSLYIKGFKGVLVDGVTILAPAWSPNTDGIDLTSTSSAIIQNCYIDTGDDNVALKSGCNNIVIRDTYCGNGHGTSIGSLGDSGGPASVSNVLVNNITFNSTLYGGRIKTFPKCQGTVTNVTFSNLVMTNVTVPMYIEQQYCCQSGSSTCSNASAAIGISAVTFANISGTVSPGSSYTAAGIFNCDSNSPCTGITLSNINLGPASTNASAPSYTTCNWVSGTASGINVPSVSGCQGISNATSSNATSAS